MEAPYSGLTPDAILTALESLGLRCDGRLLELNSYENRVYLLGMEDGESLVAKFYRPERWTNAAILEEHAFVQTLADAEIPVVPALLFNDSTLHQFNVSELHLAGGMRFAVFPKQGGRAPELGDPDTLEWMGRFIGRIHAIGALEAYTERPALDINSFGFEPRDYLLANDFIPPDLLQAYTAIVDQALENVAYCYERAGNVQQIRLHGDCHQGNVLWTESKVSSGPHFVDFDDSRMGPAIQDLWMLLSGERGDQTRQLSDVLAGYEDFYEFDPRQLHLIEALRTLRLINYSGWLARRWHDPAFPKAFPWFNTQHYWQDRILELREQIALMQEPALQV